LARYWVGGTDTWDATAGSKWASSSGGAGGESVPTAADDVFFDNNSGSGVVTLSSSSVCRSINCTGFTGTISHPASVDLTIGDATAGAGNIALQFDAGMTYTLGDSLSSRLIFVSTSATEQTIDYAGKSTASVSFNGVGGYWKYLSDHNTVSNNMLVSLTGGTLDTNEFNCSWGRFNSSNNTNFRTLDISNSTIEFKISNNYCFAIFSGSKFTLSSSGSTINTVGSSVSFDAGNRSFNDVNINGSGKLHAQNSFFAGNLTISNSLTGSVTINYCSIAGILTWNVNGSHSFNRTIISHTIVNFIINGPATKTGSISFNSSFPVTSSFQINGNSSTNRILLASSSIGTQRTFTVTSTTITAQNCDFRDIEFSVSTDLSTITGGSGDCGGNNNITFTSPQDNYWVDNGGDWSDISHWANSSGGTGGTGRVPLPQDDVYINGNSISSSSQVITIDMPRIGKSVDFTNITNSPTLTSSVNFSLYGSLILSAGITLSTATTHDVSLQGRSAFSLMSGGNNFGLRDITISMPGGSLTLLDDLLTNTGANILSVTNGTFDANDFNVTISVFNSSNSNVRTVLMGNGTWTLKRSSSTNGVLWETSTTTNLTFDAEGSTIVIISATSAKQFNGGGLIYNNFIKSSGTNSIRINGSNTFNDFTINAGLLVTFISGTTQTINGDFIAIGTDGNLVTINASTTGNQATLSKSSGTVITDYCSIKDSNAIGGARWKAKNSTDVSNNDGWLFFEEAEYIGDLDYIFTPESFTQFPDILNYEGDLDYSFIPESQIQFPDIFIYNGDLGYELIINSEETEEDAPEEETKKGSGRPYFQKFLYEFDITGKKLIEDTLTFYIIGKRVFLSKKKFKIVGEKYNQDQNEYSFSGQRLFQGEYDFCVKGSKLFLFEQDIDITARRFWEQLNAELEFKGNKT
jgi:hypothetical protein